MEILGAFVIVALVILTIGAIAWIATYGGFEGFVALYCILLACFTAGYGLWFLCGGPAIPYPNVWPGVASAWGIAVILFVVAAG